MSNTRRNTLLRILQILTLPQPVVDLFNEEGINSIGLLLNYSEMELMELKEKVTEQSFQTSHIKLIILFRDWYVQFSSNLPQGTIIDWSTSFNEDVWEQYMLDHSVSGISSLGMATQTVTNQTQNTANTSNIRNNGNMSVKIDMKSYPEFDGKLNNWKSFKQKFLSVATIHGVANIMKKTYVVPTAPSSTSEEVETFKNSNLFLQSILEYTLAKSTASSIIKRYSEDGNGRKSWLALRDWYEGQGSQETLAQEALTIISTHRLLPTSHGGANLYMEKFENALHDLLQMGKKYDDSMAKINFLNNIQDDAYKEIKEILSMDDSKTYQDCMLAIRRKSIKVEKDRGPASRKINKATRKSKSRNNERMDIRNANNINSSNWIPVDKWRKMSQEEKQKHLKTVKEGRSNPYHRKTSIPPQYGNLNQSMTEKEKKLYNMMRQRDNDERQESELTPHQQSFVNMVRSLNMLRTTSINNIHQDTDDISIEEMLDNGRSHPDATAYENTPVRLGCERNKEEMKHALLTKNATMEYAPDMVHADLNSAFTSQVIPEKYSMDKYLTEKKLSIVRYEETSGRYDEDKLLTVRKTRTKDDIHYILDMSKTTQPSNIHHQHIIIKEFLFYM